MMHSGDCCYLVLKSQHNGLVHIKFDRDLGFAGTHVTVGIGRVQRTWNQQLLPGIWLFVQKDLKTKNIVGYHSYQYHSLPKKWLVIISFTPPKKVLHPWRNLVNTDSNLQHLTVRHCSKSELRIFSASRTMRPAMTALVVAIAGMMFPAMATWRDKKI